LVKQCNKFETEDNIGYFSSIPHITSLLEKLTENLNGDNTGS